jgi:FkbM family methyltransferase
VRPLKHPRIEPLVSTSLLARLTANPVRFALAEAVARERIVAHRLAGSEVTVLLEHGSLDVAAFDEIFYQGIYEPPAEVAAVIGDTPRIVDLGANIGLFGAWALRRWPRARLVAYEPDPRNAALHGAVIRRNPAANWALHEAAAATREGRLRFAAGGYVGSRAASDDDPDAITVREADVLPSVGDADLLKIDAEGAEWALLEDPRFAAAPPRVVALEYHPEQCPEAAAGPAAHRLLRSAGFHTADVPTSSPPGYGSLWAWRADLA